MDWFWFTRIVHYQPLLPPIFFFSCQNVISALTIGYSKYFIGKISIHFGKVKFTCMSNPSYCFLNISLFFLNINPHNCGRLVKGKKEDIFIDVLSIFTWKNSQEPKQISYRDCN